tara:strand:+ start:205 stop:558 length:354 start_codon:yes stop_codon:yes gene_type:complete
MVVRAPKYFDKISAAQWRKYAPSLRERKDITNQDWHNLECFCVNYSMYRKALEDIEEKGLILKFSNDNVGQNPSFKIMTEAQKLMIKNGEKLGFDPVTRIKYPVPVEEQDDLDGLVE